MMARGTGIRAPKAKTVDDFARLGEIDLPKRAVSADDVNAWLATLPPTPLAGEVA